MTSLMISSDRPANAVPKLSDLVLLQLLQFTWGGWVGGGGGLNFCGRGVDGWREPLNFSGREPLNFSRLSTNC